MVVEVERELVAAYLAARTAGDNALVKCCFASGVRGEVSSPAYAPDVGADSESSAVDELDRMVNHKDTSIEQARLLRLYLAIKGHANSQFVEAVNFRNGRNITKDPEIARYWMEKAALNGHVGAQNDLGVMYARGFGGEKDPEKAVFWYMKSAEGGDITAKANLGRNLVTGFGVRRNYVKAARLLKESISVDPYDAWDHLMLARCYEHGVGGRNGRRLAVHHYQEAADFGSIEARYALRRLKVPSMRS